MHCGWHELLDLLHVYWYFSFNSPAIFVSNFLLKLWSTLVFVERAINTLVYFLLLINSLLPVCSRFFRFTNECHTWNPSELLNDILIIQYTMLKFWLVNGHYFGTKCQSNEAVFVHLLTQRFFIWLLFVRMCYTGLPHCAWHTLSVYCYYNHIVKSRWWYRYYKSVMRKWFIWPHLLWT